MSKSNGRKRDGGRQVPASGRPDGPAGSGERGFGLLETLAGLIVFVILVLVGTKAYRNVVANHKAADQVKSLTDAVATIAEQLSGLSLTVLAGAGSTYLEWSDPVKVGPGPVHFRYRTVPRPSIGAVVDTTLVGLEVEAGILANGAFVASRNFATLIPPAIGRSGPGQTSSEKERQEEAAFFADLKLRIAALTSEVVVDNQARLNTYSCYDRGQCCGFMREYFANPAIRPDDGLKEKCLYRCALGGNVSMPEWRESCGMDFCALAPWKTKADCCTAISTGNCPVGSVCARVCVDCVGENGSGCTEPICDGGWFNDFFNCADNTFCDGTALPAGEVPNWGIVRELCKIPACAGLTSDCGISQWVCCKDYWEPLARGETPNPKTGICAQISSQAACCEAQNRRGHWDISCTSDGRSNGARYGGTWYCADGIFREGIDQWCSIYRECRQPTYYTNPPGPDCPEWTRGMMTDPWQDPDPPPPKPAPVLPPGGSVVDPPAPVLPKPPVLTDPKQSNRIPSLRDGKKWNDRGGRE